jgi:hypothetical protein
MTARLRRAGDDRLADQAPTICCAIKWKCGERAAGKKVDARRAQRQQP